MIYNMYARPVVGKKRGVLTLDYGSESLSISGSVSLGTRLNCTYILTAKSLSFSSLSFSHTYTHYY